MPVIYIEGEGGLGNCLYQLAVALWYKETYSYYNYKIICKRSHQMLMGTSNQFERKKYLTDDSQNPVTYEKSIFKNLEFTDKKHKGKIIHNDYTDTKIIALGQDLVIKGYNQHRNLFKDILPTLKTLLTFSIPFNLGAIGLTTEQLQHAVCIGVRLGNDWRNKYTSESYKNAIETLKKEGASIDTLIVISDVDNIKEKGIYLEYPYIEVNVPDVLQFQLALECGHYILSESTFHAWIAYLGCVNNPNKKVVCFKDSDLCKRNLTMESWIQIDY
jgi:hypothetical protein